MKRLILACFCLLAALGTLAGQNNPYEIDDVCYAILQRVEAVVGDPSAEDFDEINAQLLATAIERGDTKAQTLHYVFALRRICRVSVNVPLEQRFQMNRRVDEAFHKLKEVAGEKGYTVYYRDAHGQIKGHYEDGALDKEAVAGSDITTTIDANLQAYGEILMRNKVGSVVAIEPSTGEILTMVSSPAGGRSLAGNPLSLQPRLHQRQGSRGLPRAPIAHKPAPVHRYELQCILLLCAAQHYGQPQI